jgi:hypothetical protein
MFQFDSIKPELNGRLGHFYRGDFSHSAGYRRRCPAALGSQHLVQSSVFKVQGKTGGTFTAIGYEQPGLGGSWWRIKNVAHLDQIPVVESTRRKVPGSAVSASASV